MSVTGMSQLVEVKLMVRVAAFQQVLLPTGQLAVTEMAASATASRTTCTRTVPAVGAVAS